MIHRFQMDGRYVVIDTCSGSVHAVDRIAWEMIGAYETAGREELIARMQEQTGEDPAELADFNTAYLSGYQAERYDQGVDKCAPRASERIRSRTTASRERLVSMAKRIPASSGRGELTIT